MSSAGVVGELDGLAGGVDQGDQPALVVVLGADALAAQRVDDLRQEVGAARLVVDELRHVAVAVGDGDQVAVGVVLVLDRVAHRVGARR